MTKRIELIDAKYTRFGLLWLSLPLAGNAMVTMTLYPHHPVMITRQPIELKDSLNIWDIWNIKRANDAAG